MRTTTSVDLEALLPSLLASDFPADRFEVLVVDNGSTDDSVAWTKREFPSVRLVETGGNRGMRCGLSSAGGSVMDRRRFVFSVLQRSAGRWTLC